mgnify:CR=1 FL=1
MAIPFVEFALSNSPTAAFARYYGLEPSELDAVLRRALACGGDFADIYVEYREGSSLHLEEDLLKETREVVALGAGVRVVVGEQSGYAYTNELSAANLLQAAEVAAQIAAGPSRIEAVNLQAALVPGRYPVRLPATRTDIAEKADFLFAANQATRNEDARIRDVQVTWSDELRFILLANSAGELVSDTQPLVTFSVSVIAESNGERQAGWKNFGKRVGLEAFSRQQAETLAQEAARQAVTLLAARPAPAGELPVVLAAGASGVLLHEAVGHPLEADFNRKKLSVFSGCLGEKVASELCTVVDDATLASLRGSLNVDGEGTIPRASTVLITCGVLRAYLQDRLSARLMKLAPTGNGRRQDYAHIPIPRMTNTYLAAGTNDPEEIIRSVARGIYCKSFTGGQVEPAGGKFTFSMHEAYLIEDGHLTYPIKGATLIGSGVEILNNIVAVGHDLELDPGAWACSKQGQAVPVSVGTPTVKIARMTVGGQRA